MSEKSLARNRKEWRGRRTQPRTDKTRELFAVKNQEDFSAEEVVATPPPPRKRSDHPRGRRTGLETRPAVSSIH